MLGRKRGRSEALPVLTDMLSVTGSPDAIRTIRMIGRNAEQAVPLIGQFLTDGDELQQLLTIEALGNIGIALTPHIQFMQEYAADSRRPYIDREVVH